MRDARKLFRLFKSLMEYQKVMQFSKQKMPQHKKLLSILSRLGFLFYWVFDNLSILGKIKYLEGVDINKAAKRASFFWLLGLIFSVILVLIQMYETAVEEAQLKAQLSQQIQDEKSQTAILEKYAAIKKKKFDNTLNLLKNLGDMVTAS